MINWNFIEGIFNTVIYSIATWLFICLIAEIFSWHIFYIKRKFKYGKVEGKIIEKQERRFFDNINFLPYNYYLKITKNKGKQSLTRDLLVSKEEYFKFKVGDYIKKKNFKIAKVN